MHRRVEIRLACGQSDDVLTLGLEFGGPSRHRKCRGGLDLLNALGNGHWQGGNSYVKCGTFSVRKKARWRQAACRPRRCDIWLLGMPTSALRHGPKCPGMPATCENMNDEF